jgi:beta-glucosidase
MLRRWISTSTSAAWMLAVFCLPTASVAAPAAPAAQKESDRPWLDPARSADERATLAVQQMTLDEKITLLHGPMAVQSANNAADKPTLPPDAISAAGYIPGIPRMGIPALGETDASLGVTNPRGGRPGDVATAMPASLALAASFSPELAYQAGAIVGGEAHAKGFNVLLGGGMDLTRDPRNGRNFEYLGEDPLEAGLLAAEEVRGAQDQHVISTLKHYALNANETNRTTLDAVIDRSALRESDLLAFQIAIERGKPGAIMCAYNKVNGEYACGNQWLLNDVLKKNWRYPGWVMSDWGAVHGVQDAVRGLDQESGQQLDQTVWFGAPMHTAVANRNVPLDRIDDMTRRILRSMFAVGVIEHPPKKADIDYAAHARTALEVEQDGIVLLKNTGGLLPLPGGLKRIAIIGGQAQIGVLSGGGSSQVTPSNGPVIQVPNGGTGLQGRLRSEVYFPSSPMVAIADISPDSKVQYDTGFFPAAAAALAAKSDVAIVFVTCHQTEGYDIPNMTLPQGQNELVEAVSAANARTIVVLETGNPAQMPWIDKVPAVVAAWYPGQEGGTAIAQVLFGAVAPSGHLPITFPKTAGETMRPALPNLGVDGHVQVEIEYSEGADVGYRWYARHHVEPQFAFGHGLTYTTFGYEKFEAIGGKSMKVRFDVVNTGPRAASAVPQVYLTSLAGQPDLRLLAFKRITLEPGARKTVTLAVDHRLLAHYDEAHQRWRVQAGKYTVRLGKSAVDLLAERSVQMSGATFPD